MENMRTSTRELRMNSSALQLPSFAGNQTTIQLMKEEKTNQFSRPTAIIQRVPKLWAVALEQAKRRAQQLSGGGIDYEDIMDRAAWNPGLLGLSVDIFGHPDNYDLQNVFEPPHYPAPPEQYFEDCIKMYYGELVPGYTGPAKLGEGLKSDWPTYTTATGPTSGEERLLGTQLDAAKTNFGTATASYLPALTAALESQFINASPSLFTAAPPAAATFSFANPALPGASPRLQTAAQEGLDMANKLMDGTRFQIPNIELTTDSTNSGRQGGFQSHFENASNKDKLLYFEEQCFPQGTYIPMETKILPGTVIPPETFLSPKDVLSPAVTTKVAISGTTISSTADIPGGTNYNGGDPIPPGVTLPPDILIPKYISIPAGTEILPGATVSTNVSKQANIPGTLRIPKGTVIKRGTTIPSRIPCTPKRTFSHELAHQMESYLGVEEMVALYRGLYARTKDVPHKDYNKHNIPEPGIAQTGSPAHPDYGLDLHLPDLETGFKASHTSISPEDDQSLASQKHGYVGTIGKYKRDADFSVNVQETYGTEFLSATAELLSEKDFAETLVATDPLRVALFFNIVNPTLYTSVKSAFAAKVKADGLSDTDLDKLLHADR